MSDIETSFLEHEAEFRQLIEGFNFTLPGKDASLGKDLVGVAAQSIVDRSVVRQEAPGGSTWPANAPEYAAWKLQKYGIDRVGVLTGQMLSLESIKGDVDIEEHQVVMTYGTGEKPSRYLTGEATRGNEPTDREKADYFTESGRPFYEFDEADEQAVFEEAQQALDDYLGGA